MIKDDRANLLLPALMLVFFGIVLSIACKKLSPEPYKTLFISGSNGQILSRDLHWVNGGGGTAGGLMVRRLKEIDNAQR